MCGITGIYQSNSNKGIDELFLKKMTGVLYHRGPDDEGYYFDSQVGLGIRRLSIIDLETGHQPIHNEDKTIWIVLNGEIYNYQELGKELRIKGHIFYTKSDTETIVHLYEEYGVGCLKYLRGMFAFALWDKRNKQLFVARDRVGEKPLVYTEINNYFYFASEIKSLLLIPGINREIDYEALHNYFMHVYIPAPYTIFKKIRKLPPAHYIIVSQGKVKIEKYWHCEYGNKIKTSVEEYCHRYRDLLEESIKLRLISDVPLGVMLSGGVDSSSILAMVDKAGHRPIKTFSIGFQIENKPDPEFIRAKKIARMFKTEHYEMIFNPKDLRLLPEVLSFYDEPINLFPILYAHQIAKFMKQYVTVVLAGNGADELFGGYTGYNQILKRNILYNIGSFFPLKINRNKLGRFLSVANLPGHSRRAEEFRLGAKRLADNLYTQGFNQEIKNADVGKFMEIYFQEANSKEYLDGILNIDLMFYHTHGHTLMPDISGMANSLEIRAPFLDHKLIEFAASLPVSMKIPNVFRPNFNKYIMKKSMEKMLPPDILYAPKMGFGFAIDWSNWLKTIWKEKVRNILFERSLSQTGLFNMDYIRKIYEDNVSGKKNYAGIVWGLIVFEIWHEIYVENKNPQNLL